MFLFNDHSLAQEQRANRIYEMGYLYEYGMHGMQKCQLRAEACYQEAFNLGHTGATVSLGAFAEEQDGDLTLAETFYKKAALKGNFYGLINLIRLSKRLENVEFSEKWIQLLPEEYQSKTALEFHKEYLLKNNFSINHTGMFEVPQELKEDEPKQQLSVQQKV